MDIFHFFLLFAKGNFVVSCVFRIPVLFPVQIALLPNVDRHHYFWALIILYQVESPGKLPVVVKFSFIYVLTSSFWVRQIATLAFSFESQFFSYVNKL